MENTPRDPDAVAAINDGLDRAPNALYPLVQTVLVQDEALKHADARIRELEDELGITPGQPEQSGSFLDSMRDNVAGRRGGQGSVPSVHPDASSPWNKAPAQTADSPWNKGPVLPERSSWNDPPAQAPGGRWSMGQGPQPGTPYGGPGQPMPGGPGGPGQPMPGGPYGGPGQPPPGGLGGSFLGTAAASAVGAIGGSLLMNSMRGLLGGGQPGGGKAQAALDPGGGSAASPSGSSAAGSSLSHDAGLKDIGGSDSSKMATQDNSGASQRTAMFDSAQSGEDYEADDDSGDEFEGDDFGGDSDTA